MENDDYANLMDVLQCIGVDVAGDSRCVFSLRRKLKGTVVELYGQGGMVVAAHGRRRALNLEGLGAFDVNSLKPNCAPWNVRFSSNQTEADTTIIDTHTLCVLGRPPCTAFCRWNEYTNYRGMDPQKVEHC